MVDRVSGLHTRCMSWTNPPTMSWIQKIQGSDRLCSTNPPAMAPTTDPPTDDKTRNAKAYSCSSGSHMSARTPSVTEPPAVERPPRKRQTAYVSKLVDRAQGICQMLTRKRLSCWMGQ